MIVVVENKVAPFLRTRCESFVPFLKVYLNSYSNFPVVKLVILVLTVVIVNENILDVSQLVLKEIFLITCFFKQNTFTFLSMFFSTDNGADHTVSVFLLGLVHAKNEFVFVCVSI